MRDRGNKGIFFFVSAMLLTGCAQASVQTELIESEVETTVSTSLQEQENEQFEVETKEDMQELSFDVIESWAKKHGELSVTDLEAYIDLSPLKEQGYLSEQIPFMYNGETMYVRINASDKAAAYAPYEETLDSIVVFCEDFLDIATDQEQYHYSGTCTDIRAGKFEHILNGTVELKDYLTLDLPQDMMVSKYNFWMGTHGGFYFTKDENEIIESDLQNVGLYAETPMLGGVQIMEGVEIAQMMQQIEEMNSLTCDDVTIVRGLYETEMSTKWYLAYTECPNSHISYCVYLNPQDVTQEEFLQITDTIQLDEYAIY